MKRKTLIQLCKDAVVHHTKWRDRDSFIAQKGIQSIYKGLTAGLSYKVLTKEISPKYHSDVQCHFTDNYKLKAGTFTAN